MCSGPISLGTVTFAASGVQSLSPTTPHTAVDADTLFEIGSLSKTMTALALATRAPGGD